MWSWREQLKEPVTTNEDVDTLVGSRADAAEALFVLDKGQHQTILCVLHCAVSLQAVPGDVREAILARAIKAFTKVGEGWRTSQSLRSTQFLLFSSDVDDDPKGRDIT